MAHIHEVIDMDKHFVIDPVTRIITNATPEKKMIMQYDHNSERYTFELPRYIDGHDMSLCDVVQVHYIDISPDKRTQKTGVYEVDDLQLASSDEGTDDIVLCSWLISQNATQIYGFLNFLVRYSCTTNGTVDYAWNTAIFSGITVSNGIYNGPAVAEEYADILEQWRQELFSGGGGGSVTIDSALSTISKNPVQNKAITAELEKKGEVKTVNGNAPDAAGNVAISVGSGEGTGTPGEDGGYYTPAVSDAGDLSWTASKDGMPEVAGTNIKGPKGDTPVKGVDYFTDEDVALIAEEAAKLVNVEIPSIEQLDAEKVFFNSDLVTTHAIGNIVLSNGQATIPAAGKNLKEVWNRIFVQEKNPSTVQPSVSLSVPQAKAYEVGTKITPSYSATLNPGSYSYGPATGVTATAWEVTDTAGNTANTTASGNFPELQVVDGISYKITAKATHGDGVAPVTNVGNTYPDGQIKAGTKSATSSVAITGYRNSFYGTLTEKSDLTSDVVRGLTKSGKALANGNSFTVTVPIGALRVVIAYPATLRDITSVKDVNGMNAEISSGFSKSTIAVEGMNHYDAINYKVYTMDFAAANDTANKLTVTI